jgi:uncharacterized protein
MKKVLLDLLDKYQTTISPYFKKNGYKCLFVPTCSVYAVNCLKKYSTIKALSLIIMRVLSCNPINVFLHTRRKEAIYG